MNNLLFACISFTFLLASCNSSSSPESAQQVSASSIQLTRLEGSPEYPGAMLQNTGVTFGDSNKVNFSFEVSGYLLGEQTADAEMKGIANSGKGQHIHLILNNGPYYAQYSPNFTLQLEPGHYTALAFLSRSYHESVKAENAAQVWQFSLGTDTSTPPDLENPILFYSRPKGVYKGSETKKVLLDFYLHNVTLSETGYKVKATINGQEFMITEWAPYLMEGLPMGENMVRLELLDSEGNLVPAIFNPMERKFTLEEAAG